MNDENRFCSGRDGIFNLPFVDVHCFWMNVNEHRRRTARDDGVCRGREGVAGHDDFIACMEVAKARRHLKCRRSTRCQKRFCCSGFFFNPLVALLCESAITANSATFSSLLDIFQRGIEAWCNVKLNHNFTSVFFLFLTCVNNTTPTNISNPTALVIKPSSTPGDVK